MNFLNFSWYIELGLCPFFPLTYTCQNSFRRLLFPVHLHSIISCFPWCFMNLHPSLFHLVSAFTGSRGYFLFNSSLYSTTSFCAAATSSMVHLPWAVHSKDQKTCFSKSYSAPFLLRWACLHQKVLPLRIQVLPGSDFWSHLSCFPSFSVPLFLSYTIRSSLFLSHKNKSGKLQIDR